MSARPVPGYDGYTATIDGTILDRDGTEVPLVEQRKVHPKALLPGPGGPLRVEVRRLVWTAWHGPVPKGFAIAHINGNRFDNSVENLTLVPRKSGANAATVPMSSTIRHRFSPLPRQGTG